MKNRNRLNKQTRSPRLRTEGKVGEGEDEHEDEPGACETGELACR